ncbi:MAG: hypothetical protein K2Y13_10340 [Burkholderiaceae bacterium]|uniref:Uncharacterized protein n=1 Tax=Herminiimonas contaminans TaxID=1111140 RepID=A0ABS0EYT5_9BURK|nr:hypothetical protein [Herminiimonas contaminans]MBF8179609.1 hypothetical protein [Herminiimonas contaminans]MBX9799847.1 hypothetical protein [Burkholderiaceae bacterium]
MGNVSNNAYAITCLCPIQKGHIGGTAYSDEVRRRLQDWGLNEMSPMAKVPQTYLCRYFVLDDVYYESLPGTDFGGTWYDFLSIFSDRFRRAALPEEDHLQSKYLVWCCNIHGDPDTYLRGMWNAISDDIRHLWGFCYGFEHVSDADSFIAYIKKCQLTASLFFVGSNDEPLPEQLKGLYLKQEFSRFVTEHQGLPAAELQQAYQAFIQRVNPTNLQEPTWLPGQSTLQTQS